MNDINFFSTFSKEKAQLRQKTIRTRKIIWGVILIIVLFYGILGLRILYMYSSIQNSGKFLSAQDVSARLEVTDAKRVASQSMVKYDAELEKAAQKIVLTDRVGTELLDKIQNAFPAAASLTYLDLKESQLTLKGNASVWTTAAELSHNLEAAGLFSRVQINSVTKNKDSDTYYFSLLCDFKEVAAQ
ncbi:MAG TPA: PilN domain-containing protein [Desulfitobacteriaceae bacterium]|nr:PilN domain-containing protein [Desulfitobacteriaceae bacterium]